jgi:hypothetical protein
MMIQSNWLDISSQSNHDAGVDILRYEPDIEDFVLCIAVHRQDFAPVRRTAPYNQGLSLGNKPSLSLNIMTILINGGNFTPC